MPSDLPHPGELLAGYRIERQLGRGATGVVYLARQVALDRPVALKVVGAPFALDEAFRERFRREARTAAGLDHPNVVTVLDSGEDDERLWLAMRLVDGPDLGVLLRRTGRLEPAHAVSVVEQIAAALDAAHAAGLVHRDVKPANILVEDAPGGALHAELADFGLVGPAGDASLGAVPADGGPVAEGTPEYAAPEQLAGHEATVAADVHALGRVFAEMLTGDPATPAGPGAIGFAAVVARATDPDPAWRYPTAGALAVAARAVLEPAGGSSPSPGPAAVAGRLPTPAEVESDIDHGAEYEDVAPLTSPSTRGRASRRRRATTLVAAPRRRRRRRTLPLLVLLGVVTAAALILGELRGGLLESDPASDRSRSTAPAAGSSAAGGAGPSPARGAGSSGSSAAGTGGAAPSGRSGGAAGESTGGRPSDATGAAAGNGSGAVAEGPATGSNATSATDGAPPSSTAPELGGAGPGVAATDAALPPAQGRRRFGGGSWLLDLPSSAGWRQTAVQELSGGRTVLTRLRRGDGTRLVVEHRPGQTAVFGPWPGRPFVVRVPDAGRIDALLFRGGRYAMCRDGVCAAAAVNGPSGGVLLIAASWSDADARRELRRAASGLRVG